MRSHSYKLLQLKPYFRQFFDGPKNFLFSIDFYREIHWKLQLCQRGFTAPQIFQRVHKGRVRINRAYNCEKIEVRINEVNKEEMLVHREGEANSMALGGEHNKQHTTDDSNSNWECCEELLGFI